MVINMYDPCNFCGYMSISDRQRGLCYEKCLYQQALAKARLYDSIPKIDIKQFNENKVSQEFLESCAKAGKLFNRR